MSQPTTAYQTDIELLTALVSRVMRIEDVTSGSPKEAYIARFRGQLINEDSAALYDQLAAALRPQHITPLFRWDKERHVILLVPGMPDPKPSNPRTNLILFVLTLLSVIYTGAMYGADQMPFAAGFNWAELGRFLWSGLPFAVAMLGILGAHEFGHYLVGRHHGVNVTLPYFIPFPFSPFGTMGAFINMKELPKNRRVLLDIGMAGPLAGLVVAIPVLLIGLAMSHVGPIAQPGTGQALQMEGNSLLYLLIKYISFGRLLPEPASYGAVPPLLYWLRYFFTSQPLPLLGTDVQLSAVAWAGWAGILVTSLNLIPAGQLDGGHILYTLFGSKIAQRVLPFILISLVLMGFVWNVWWLWAALIFFMGRWHAEPLDQITPLDPRRRIMAAVMIAVFVLVFTPVPIILLIG